MTEGCHSCLSCDKQCHQEAMQTVSCFNKCISFFANLMHKPLTKPVTPLKSPVTLQALQKEELQVSSCYICALVQKAVNSAPGLQQNCTTAGKLPWKSYHPIFCLSQNTQRSFPLLPHEQKQQCMGMGLRSSSPQATHQIMCLPQATSLCHFLPHPVDPWTSQEERSDLHPPMGHEWLTHFHFSSTLSG